MSDGPGHNTNPFKNFDVMRCVKCDKIMKVPKTAWHYECPHCGTYNVYEEEKSDGEG